MFTQVIDQVSSKVFYHRHLKDLTYFCNHIGCALLDTENNAALRHFHFSGLYAVYLSNIFLKDNKSSASITTSSPFNSSRRHD